jgi:hypothetical protein
MSNVIGHGDEDEDASFATANLSFEAKERQIGRQTHCQS